MTGRFLARLLAPLALVACAVALVAIVSSGTEDGADSSAAPTATVTPEPKAKERRRSGRRTYVVKPGDTPSAIAEAQDVDVDALLAANPDVDPNALTVGDELKLP